MSSTDLLTKEQQTATTKDVTTTTKSTSTSTPTSLNNPSSSSSSFYSSAAAAVSTSLSTEDYSPASVLSTLTSSRQHSQQTNTSLSSSTLQAASPPSTSSTPHSSLIFTDESTHLVFICNIHSIDVREYIIRTDKYHQQITTTAHTSQTHHHHHHHHHRPIDQTNDQRRKQLSPSTWFDLLTYVIMLCIASYSISQQIMTTTHVNYSQLLFSTYLQHLFWIVITSLLHPIIIMIIILQFIRKSMKEAEVVEGVQRSVVKASGSSSFIFIERSNIADILINEAIRWNKVQYVGLIAVYDKMNNSEKSNSSSASTTTSTTNNSKSSHNSHGSNDTPISSSSTALSNFASGLRQRQTQQTDTNTARPSHLPADTTQSTVKHHSDAHRRYSEDSSINPLSLISSSSHSTSTSSSPLPSPPSSSSSSDHEDSEMDISTKRYASKTRSGRTSHSTSEHHESDELDVENSHSQNNNHSDSESITSLDTSQQHEFSDEDEIKSIQQDQHDEQEHEQEQEQLQQQNKKTLKQQKPSDSNKEEASIKLILMFEHLIPRYSMLIRVYHGTRHILYGEEDDE